MKKRVTIIVFVVLFGLIALTGCGFLAEKDADRTVVDAGMTTDTWSSSFDTPEDRIAFLEPYLKFSSDVLDTEYHVFYQDNTKGLVPGPSYWTYSVMIRVQPEDVSLWVKDYGKAIDETAAEEIDFSHWDGLPFGAGEWSVESEPLCYQGGHADESLLIYEAEGILLYCRQTG